MARGEGHPMRKLATLLAVAAEGIAFLWSVRKARGPYIQWRLGTLYGSFDRATGQPRPIRDLLDCLWRDRKSVTEFLLWRRKMRR
jgi:hypothetical protein